MSEISGVSLITGGPEIPKDEVLAELSKVLESAHFRASKKCTRFLRHLVENALESRFDCLKERTLGVDVFDRSPHYDTNQDPVVRGTAGEVRKRLAQYYLESGQHDEIRISVPPGSYIPEVHRTASRHALTVEAASAPLLSVSSGPPLASSAVVTGPELELSRTARPVKTAARWEFRTVALIAVLLCIAPLAYLYFRPAPLDRFWAPVLEGRKSVLVCMGQPQEYTFRPDTALALKSWFAGRADKDDLPPPFASISLDQIVPIWSNSVALADSQAFARVFNLFARKGKQADLRGERSVSLADLRGRPSILIGAFDNVWTLTLSRELRFYFDQDERTHEQVIRDRQKPGEAPWKVVNAWPPDRKADRDYALVTRVFNHTTEQTVVAIAGIAQYGTEAAAEFVTNPEYFSAALTNAPGDWDHKNIEIVLSTRVMAETSGPPQVLAAYFW